MELKAIILFGISAITGAAIVISLQKKLQIPKLVTTKEAGKHSKCMEKMKLNAKFDPLLHKNRMNA